MTTRTTTKANKYQTNLRISIKNEATYNFWGQPKMYYIQK